MELILVCGELLCERVHNFRNSNFEILSKRIEYTILACGGPRPSAVYLLQLGFTSEVNTVNTLFGSTHMVCGHTQGSDGGSDEGHCPLRYRPF